MYPDVIDKMQTVPSRYNSDCCYCWSCKLTSKGNKIAPTANKNELEYFNFKSLKAYELEQSQGLKEYNLTSYKGFLKCVCFNAQRANLDRFGTYYIEEDITKQL